MSLSSRIAVVMCGLVIFAGTVSAGVIYWRFNDQLVTAKLADLERETELQATRFVSQIDELMRDALFLSGIPPVQGIVRAGNNGGIDPVDDSPQSAWETRLGVIFKEVLISKPSYVQIRYIGVANGGMELVRVDRVGSNSGVKVVPENALQKKSSRDYFSTTLQGEPDTVYLSAISLNRERGEIQQPHTPVIRASVPVVSRSGSVFGMIVINFGMSRLFNELTNVSNPSHNYFLSNGEGSYLKHPEPSREFGFEFGNEGMSFEEFPQLKRLQTGKSSTASEKIEDEQRVVSMRQVYFGPPEQNRVLDIIVTDSFDDITRISRTVFQQVGLVVGLLLVLGLWVGVWLAKWVTAPITRLTESVKHANLTTATWKKPQLLHAEAEQLGEALDTAFTSLREKTQELAASNSELYQFASIASHDLQEPVRTISNFSTLLNAKYGNELDEAGKQYLTFITESCGRMQLLITGLLEYSRLGSESVAKIVSIDEMLQAIQTDMQATIVSSGAHISVQPMPTLNVYATELRVLFQNLISNAIKYVAVGVTPKVEISCSKEAGGWKFSVTDNGLGIAEAHREQIFVIFQRLHVRGEYPGSGIGLANCSKIVGLHQGKIWVEQAPGGGSIFRFLIKEVGQAPTPALQSPVSPE